MMVIIFILFSTTCNADEKREAFSGIYRAILGYSEVKEYRKTAERKALKAINVDKSTMGAVGAVAAIAYSKNIDSNKFAKIRFKSLGARIQPNVSYNFENRQSSANINIGWEF